MGSDHTGTCRLFVLTSVLLDELQHRVRSRGWKLSWFDIRQDLLALPKVEFRQDDQWSYLRTALQGCAGKVLQAVGVKSPAPVCPKENKVVPEDTCALNAGGGPWS